MGQVTVIIPNYNGKTFLDGVLCSMERQTYKEIKVLLVDNGSSDGSCDYVKQTYPWVELVELKENLGFAEAVNVGIRQSDTPYVLLLNNDTEAEPEFVEELVKAIKRHKRAFSCQAKMIQLHNRAKMDDAGDSYCALGWAFARGKDKPVSDYEKEMKIFSSCAGAAIYRRKLFDKIGLFDKEHFAYLEDLDVCYRARIQGYENWYAPKALVYHVGSGTSGSRYNQFKIRYSSRNNIYLIYKNMPGLQILLNLPFLIPGFGAKILFFASKGYGREYLAGIKNGFQISRQNEKVKFQLKNLPHYLRIQGELWINILRRFRG